MIGAVVLNLLLAFNLILRKFVLAAAEPIFFQGIRLFLAGAVLLSYLYFFNPQIMRIKRKDIMLFFQASLFFSYVSYVFAAMSLDDISSARYAFMFNLTPFLTALLAYFALGERLSSKEMFSLIIGFLGFLPLIFAEHQDGAAGAGFISIPGLQLFIAVAAYAYGWVVTSKLVNERNYSPFLVTGISFFSGGIAALLTSLALETHNDIPAVSSWPHFIIYLASIVFISEVLCYNMYAFLLKRYSATFLAFAGFLYPIFGALFGWLFLQERITYNFLISTVVVTGALYMYYLAEKHKKKMLVRNP